MRYTLAARIPRRRLTVALLVGCICGCFIPQANAQTQVTRSNWTPPSNSTWDLSDNANWDPNYAFPSASPETTQIAVFNQAVFGNNLHLKSSDWHALGMQIDSQAGALTFDSAGSGGAKYIYVGSAGIVSNSLNSVTFDISTKVNLGLDADASLAANGPGAILIQNAGATFTIGSFNLTLDGVATNTTSAISQAISGSGNLSKTGAGTWTLSGANSYTGTTTINQGTLSVGNIDASSGSSNLGNATSSVVLGGGAGSTGTLSYTGSNATFTRGFTVNAGGGEFDTTTSGQTVTIDTGGVTANGAFTIGGAGNTTINSVISGLGGLAKTGAGTLTLGGNNTYSGITNVLVGTLKLGSATAFSPNTTLNVTAGATFDRNGFALDVGNITSPLDGGSAGLAFQPTGTTTASGVLSGTGGLTLNGSGTLVLGAANNFTGPVVLTQGTLRLDAAGALPSGAPINLGSGATLDLNGHDATLGSLAGGGNLTNGGANLTVAQSGNTLFSGVISGAGGLTKSGADQLILTGIQTFSGPTTVSAGDLKINGSAAFSAFTITGGILSGNGTVGPLTVASGGTLSPGSSPGLLIVSGDLTLAGTTAMELSGTTRGVGGYDAVNVGGAISFGGTLTLSLINGFNPLSGQSFNLFDWTGTRSGTFGAVNLPSLAGGLTWDADALYTSGALSITASAIPEPSAYAAFAGAALLGFAAWRRRRERTQAARH